MEITVLRSRFAIIIMLTPIMLRALQVRLEETCLCTKFLRGFLLSVTPHTSVCGKSTILPSENCPKMSPASSSELSRLAAKFSLIC